MRTLPALLGAALAAACLIPADPAAAYDPPGDGTEFFEKKIRPLLVEHCYQCHSTAHKKSGGLLLDSKAAAFKGGLSGPAIVPNKVDDSLLIQAVRYTDPELKMPKRGKLSDQQIADLEQWVRIGAPWPDDKGGKGIAVKPFDLKERSKFWSLQPVRKPTVPTVTNAAWCQSPVDRFILAKLDAAGLKPAPSADRRTLLRRVTFDLIGLPPTPAEIDAFLADDSPDAFAKVVDRLLASPHYGERWGRHWLDLVRFAETQGHEFDFELPEAYLYRDYVIRAFNDDVPYDQLVLEHIAGDLLPAPRRHPTQRFNESILATGFWNLGEAKHSPVDSRADQADRIDNQIDVFSKTFLGLTVACARCHDHKFDAISTKDYYALSGYLQSARWQRAFIDDPAPTKERIGKLLALQADLKQQLPALAPAHTPASEALVDGTVFADFRKDTFAKWFVSGPAFGNGPTTAGALLVQPHGKQPLKVLAPGLAHSGIATTKLAGVLRSQTFVIGSRKIHYRACGEKGRINLVLDGLILIRDPIYGGLTIQVNHGDALQWKTMDVSMWQGHRAYIEFVDDGPGYLGVQQVVFSDGGPPAANDKEVAAVPAKDMAPVAELLKDYAAVEASLPTPTRALALEEGSPVDERVFIGGRPKNLGDVVPRRFLEVLEHDAPPSSEPARLALARKVADPSNPLTARVIVNRLWKHHFGEGLVRTPDDFGVLGQAPTHRELLDWLAARFVEDGWSLKKMHRLLLLSSTYQMASRGDAAADVADPDNKLLHRMSVRRLEAEAIRDAMLAVSGRLDHKMYGPGVLPYLTPFMLGRGRPGASGPLDGDGRRTIYLNVRRNFLTPMLLAFDYPTPFTTIGKRGVSNVPAQALTLMNNPYVLQQADVWGKAVASARGLSAKQRVELMYVTAFARPPSPRELEVATQFVAEQGQAYGREDDPRVWADLAHVLFNVKEFIFVH